MTRQINDSHGLRLPDDGFPSGLETAKRLEELAGRLPENNFRQSFAKHKAQLRALENRLAFECMLDIG